MSYEYCAFVPSQLVALLLLNVNTPRRQHFSNVMNVYSFATRFTRLSRFARRRDKRRYAKFRLYLGGMLSAFDTMVRSC